MPTLTRNEYWREREKLAIASQKARGKTLKQEMDDLYAYHYKAIETEVEGFLHRYAEANKIDMVEARKRVDELDVVAFETKAKKYVAEKDFSSRANAELKLYNLKMRMKAHELLQYQLDLEMLALTEGERQLTEKFLTASYVQEMKRQAGLLGYGIASSERIAQLAQASLNANFHGANWSDRIWDRQDALREILQRDIEGMLFRGKHPTIIISKLRQEFDTSVYEAKRLAVTEMARLSVEAQKQAFMEYGYEWYEFIAEPGACPVCAGLDRQVFKVAKMRIGENAPPMHPNCHCSTGAVENDKSVEKATDKVYNQDMGSSIEIDKFTPCLENVKTGEIVKTNYFKSVTITKAEASVLNGKGWLFDWSIPQKNGYDVYKLYRDGSDRIEGMVAFKSEVSNSAVHIDIVESAPENLGDDKEFYGVGGHLFAIAAKASYKEGYGGFTYFTAKTDLMAHYQKELGAKIVTGRVMAIDEQAAYKLLSKYELIERSKK